MTVAADVMFVNRIPFVVSVLRGVNLTMVEYFIQWLKTVLANSIREIFQFYKNNGYTIKTFLMDREFECICGSLPEEANLNTTAKNEIFTDIERKNCVIKEPSREVISTFPFNNTPGRIIIEIIRFVGIWLNQEPSENGVSDVYSTRNIIMGKYLA